MLKFLAGISQANLRTLSPTILGPTISHVNLTLEKLSIHCQMFCKLDVRRKSIVTLALS